MVLQVLASKDSFLTPLLSIKLSTFELDKAALYYSNKYSPPNHSALKQEKLVSCSRKVQ